MSKKKRMTIRKWTLLGLAGLVLLILLTVFLAGCQSKPSRVAVPVRNESVPQGQGALLVSNHSLEITNISQRAAQGLAPLSFIANHTNTSVDTQCPDVFDPVCATNGQSYRNSCEAQKNSSVSVAYSGFCRTIERPAGCEDGYGPVCSKAGKTYDTSCALTAASEQLAFVGPCENASVRIGPNFCGNIDAFVCGANGVSFKNGCLAQTFNQFNYTSGPCHSSSVVPAPTAACANVTHYVCGTDGKTYLNACYANQSGVKIAWFESCSEPHADLCTGKHYAACAIYNVSYADACSAPSGTELLYAGVCADSSASVGTCGSKVSLVCGSNGITFQNTCVAAYYNITVAGTGRCGHAANG